MNDGVERTMTELKPCPFCGGEARVFFTEESATWDAQCQSCGAMPYVSKTEQKAIGAWNSRAPIEYDGWFYLPKPKEGIVDYGEPEITRTENGYKVRHIAAVVDEAARKWGEELGEYVMRRICEIWNIRESGEERIVRCRDCIYYKPDQDPIDPGWPMMCERTGDDMVEPYGYCAWGERKGE